MRSSGCEPAWPSWRAVISVRETPRKKGPAHRRGKRGYRVSLELLDDATARANAHERYLKLRRTHPELHIDDAMAIAMEPLW